MHTPIGDLLASVDVGKIGQLPIISAHAVLKLSDRWVVDGSCTVMSDSASGIPPADWGVMGKFFPFKRGLYLGAGLQDQLLSSELSTMASLFSESLARKINVYGPLTVAAGYEVALAGKVAAYVEVRGPFPALVQAGVRYHLTR